MLFFATLQALAPPASDYESTLTINIAVIVVNWNAGELLRACVESILRQSYPARRVIVVDNASRDGSIEFIEAGNLPVTVIRNNDNRGFAEANNQAVALAEDCQWLALLNPDAVAAPDWLEQMLEGVHRYPAIRAFASRMMMMGSDQLLDGAGDNYHIFGVPGRRFHGKSLAAVAAAQDQPVFGACGGAAFYHRQTFMAMEGFDSSFFCYLEDIDLAFRMQLCGYRCIYLHAAVVEHLGAGTSDGQSGFAEYYGHRNLVWTWVKNMPLPLLLLLLPGHLLVNVLAILQKGRQGKGAVVVKSKWHALVGLPRQLSKRRAIQANRRISLGALWRIMSKSFTR
jgi:GT2 family glycosyltransferase